MQNVGFHMTRLIFVLSIHHYIKVIAEYMFSSKQVEKENIQTPDTYQFKMFYFQMKEQFCYQLSISQVVIHAPSFMVYRKEGSLSRSSQVSLQAGTRIVI